MNNLKALVFMAVTTAIINVAFDVSAAGFQYEIPLNINTNSKANDATGFSFQVPPEVYLNAQSPKLRDVRVKNVQGDEVPMRLTLSEDDLKQRLSTSTLPIFSLNQTITTPLRTKQVSTSWQGAEQQFSLKTSESVQNFIRSQERVMQDRFLLDASSLKQATIAALELKWQFDTPGNRVFFVEVKGSHDLSNWQTVHSKFKLIELNTGQRVVLENIIPVLGQAFSYYQLRFVGEPIPEVTEVKALMSSHALEQPLITRKVNSFEVLDPEQHGHAITWDSGGFFPVETVQFDFDYKNLMADVHLYSKATEQSNWKRVISSQLYQVGSGDMSMAKNNLNFGSNRHRYWKLSTKSSISSQWLNGVTLSWRPHQLQFLAQGNAPYSLLFGDPNLHSTPADSWYQQLNKQVRNELFSNQIKLGAMQELAPSPKAVEPEPDGQFSRRVFWSLLVVVLAGLLYMATRLMKEVSESE